MICASYMPAYSPLYSLCVSGGTGGQGLYWILPTNSASGKVHCVWRDSKINQILQADRVGKEGQGGKINRGMSLERILERSKVWQQSMT